MRFEYMGASVTLSFDRVILFQGKYCGLSRVVAREFTNELGNRIKITIEGPTSVSENLLTPFEASELRDALTKHQSSSAMEVIMGRSNLGKAIYLEVAFQQDLQNKIIGRDTPRWDYLFLLLCWWDAETGGRC